MLEYSNTLSAKEYCELRSAVAWQPIIEEQAQSGLNGSDFMIACRDDDNIVGCARIFWDKGYIAYLADVMVKPEYQKQGITYVEIADTVLTKSKYIILSQSRMFTRIISKSRLRIGERYTSFDILSTG